jgi:hypothetical protein
MNLASGFRSWVCVRMGERWSEPKKPSDFSGAMEGLAQMFPRRALEEIVGAGFVGVPHASHDREAMNPDLKRWTFRKDGPVRSWEMEDDARRVKDEDM